MGSNELKDRFVTIRLSNETFRALKDLSRELGVTLQQLCREFLAHGLEKARKGE